MGSTLTKAWTHEEHTYQGTDTRGAHLPRHGHTRSTLTKARTHEEHTYQDTDTRGAHLPRHGGHTRSTLTKGSHFQEKLKQDDQRVHYDEDDDDGVNGGAMECNLHLTLPSGHGGRNGDIQNAIKEMGEIDTSKNLCMWGGGG